MLTSGTGFGLTIIVTLGVIADAAHKTRVRFTVTAGRPAALAGSRSLRASVPTWGQVLGRNGENTYVTTYVGPNAHAKPIFTFVLDFKVVNTDASSYVNRPVRSVLESAATAKKNQAQTSMRRSPS